MTRSLRRVLPVFFLAVGAASLLTLTHDARTAPPTWVDKTAAIQLTDIGVGGDNSMYALNKAVANDDGYAVVRWDGKRWETLTGASAVAIDVGRTRDDVWAVNKKQEIYAKRPGGDNWDKKPGSAVDVGIGNGVVWVIGADNRPLRWNGSGWDADTGLKGVRIDVDKEGRAGGRQTQLVRCACRKLGLRGVSS